MASISITAPRFERRDLAMETSSLTPKQHEAAQKDLYGGVKNATKEDVTTHDQALLALSQEIALIQDKPAFLLALQRCPDYVRNKKFGLSFLRAERFDARRAAQRLTLYWKEKLDLFGPQKAFRHLTIHDLEPQDVESLRQGSFLMPPGKDSGGRGLLFSDRMKWTHDRESMVSFSPD